MTSYNLDILRLVYSLYLNLYLDTNQYDQWRSNIHRSLEEDLQRQVQQVLEETERQERLAKIPQQYIRYEKP
jgi:hypothetical protein